MEELDEEKTRMKEEEDEGAILVEAAGSFRTSVYENPMVLSSLTYYSATRCPLERVSSVV